MFICATKDFVLKPEFATHMGVYLTNMTRKDVAGSHWLLWEKSEEVNEHLKQWFESVVIGEKSKL